MAEIGNAYQRETKYVRGRLPGRSADPLPAPDTYKRYPDALEVIDLPGPKKTHGMGLWQVIAERRSIREYSAQPLSLEELTQLLWATQGITARDFGFEFRAAPSAGALYPCETYLVVNRVRNLEPGVYHYVVAEAKLELLRRGDFARDIAAACLDQQMCASAAVVFAWTAIPARSRWKYGERAYRYMYLDAGHIGGQLHLAAVALGLGCCAIGAFFDDEVNAVLGVDGEEETILYLSSVGKP